MVLTGGWAHNVLLLYWHRAGRRSLVHLEKGFARVLPGGGLVKVTSVTKKERATTCNET